MCKPRYVLLFDVDEEDMGLADILEVVNFPSRFFSSHGTTALSPADGFTAHFEGGRAHPFTASCIMFEEAVGCGCEKPLLKAISKVAPWSFRLCSEVVK